MSGHGTAPHSLWGRGVWPRCVCGFDPHDNAALNDHYAEHGFEEAEDHGHLIRRPVQTNESDEPR